MTILKTDNGSSIASFEHAMFNSFFVLRKKIKVHTDMYSNKKVVHEQKNQIVYIKIRVKKTRAINSFSLYKPKTKTDEYSNLSIIA